MKISQKLLLIITASVLTKVTSLRKVNFFKI